MKKLSLFFITALLFSCHNHNSSQKEPIQDTSKQSVCLQQDQDVNIDAIKESILTKFADFELYDLLSVNMDDENGKGYVWLIKDTDSTGIILAYKFEKETLTLLEENENILKEYIDIGRHELVKEDNSRFFLRSEYGANARSGEEAYFTFTSEGVFVDSLVMFRKIYDNENEAVYLECFTITQKDFGKIRLKDLTNDIWANYDKKIVFERRD